MVLILTFPSGALAAECTDTWTGAAEGTWGTAANWSAKHVPTSEDVACIGSGKTVKVASEGKAAIVQGEGSILISSNSLELISIKEASTISSLTLNGGGLKGPGTLNISKSFLWNGSNSPLNGTGSLVILSGAEGTVSVVSGGLANMLEHKLVNQGTLALSGGYVKENKGAEIVNEGTFTVNSEHEPAIELGTTGSSKLVNSGTLRKTSGEGTSEIMVPIENKGTIESQTGKLAFRGGGSSSSSNRWEAATGAEVVFGSGTFSLSGGVWAGHVAVSSMGAAPVVNVQGVNGEAAQVKIKAFSGALNVESGTMTVESLEQVQGSLSGPGTLKISKSFLWNGSNGPLNGTGSTVILPGAEGTVSPEALANLLERKLVNQGTLALPSGHIRVQKGAEIVNEGTFTVNSEDAPAIELGTGSAKLVNSGTFRKTSGTGTTEIQPNFENFGAIQQISGKLEIQHEIRVKASTATPGKCKPVGDPVDCATGNLTETQTDFEIGGRGVGLDLVRTYSAQAAKAEALGIFGYGWTNSFGDKLTSEESGAKQTLTGPSGATVTFTKSDASYLAPSWSQDVLTGSTEAGFTLTLPSQTKEKFNGSGRLESVTDRNGNEMTLAYNGSGKLETITDPAGRKITLTYNGEGLVEKAKDPTGHEVKYTYESKKLKSVTLPGEASATWQFGYDSSRRMTSITDGLGGKTTNEYDSSSRVISQTDPAERITTFEYGAFHTKITNKATGAVTDEWFTSNNQPVSVTHGFGTTAETTTSLTYTTAGLLASRTDGNGHTWTYGYDANGNRTSEIDPLEHETKRTYNEAHQVLTETKPSGKKTTITRDANGNPETVSQPAPESKTQTVSYEYGPHGEVNTMTDPLSHVWSYEYDSYGDLKAEIDPEGDKRSWGYDEDSRVTSAISPRGNEEGAEPAKFTTAVERDARGRPLKVTDPLEGTTKYAYDANGNVETITDPNGRKTKFSYDADNERTKVERPDGAVEEAGYDGAGQVTSQIDGNKQKTTYIRNVLEQPVEIIDPLERKTTETFDAAGNLKTKKDPDGRTTTYAYDNANRLKEVTYSDGVTPNATFGYDKNGNLTSMVDGTGESSYEYDQLDRLTHSEDGNGDTVSWEYNLGNEPVDLTYPNGKSISRAYDKAGRLESIADWLGHTTSFAYNKDAELKATTFPSGTGDLDEYAFDRADRMSSVTMKKGAETLASLSYGRDKAGQVESLISKGLPGAEEESFAYDENERLKTAGVGSYEYDNANNLTKAPGTTNAFDKASQLESATGATFTYDKEGERTKRTPSSGPATTYKYDQAGNLTAVERPEEGETPAIAESFTYDGTGLLTSKTVGLSTQHLTWDSNEALPQALSDGKNSYLYGPSGLPIEQISIGEAPTYLHHDQLGSTRLLTNSSGEVSGSATFTPYGGLEGKTVAASSPLGYAGQYSLGQSGLIYLRARFYDPGTPQFMTSDPAVEATHEPYAYAGDNPMRFKDPMGLSFAEDIEGVGIPCVWCEAARGVQEMVEPSFNEFLHDAGWVLHNSFGAEELDESADEAQPCVEPLPPGHNPDTWERRPGSREGSGEHWWDPEGGEWGWHAPDKHHPEGHWNYNPWRVWNDEWQNVFPGDG
jgi:RHS repeat-associated protein